MRWTHSRATLRRKRLRRFHDLRRTGITLFREDGAERDVLRLCTHGAPGQDVMELYTS